MMGVRADVIYIGNNLHTGSASKLEPPSIRPVLAAALEVKVPLRSIRSEQLLCGLLSYDFFYISFICPNLRILCTN